MRFLWGHFWGHHGVIWGHLGSFGVISVDVFYLSQKKKDIKK